jgi:hypothetical protein
VTWVGLAAPSARTLQPSAGLRLCVHQTVVAVVAWPRWLTTLPDGPCHSRYYAGEIVDLPNCNFYGKAQTLRGKVTKVIKAPTFKFVPNLDKVLKRVDLTYPDGAAPAVAGSAAVSEEDAASYEVTVYPRSTVIPAKSFTVSPTVLRRRRKDGFNKDVLKVCRRVDSHSHMHTYARRTHAHASLAAHPRLAMVGRGCWLTLTMA